MSKKSGTTSLSNGTLSLRFMQRGATQRVSTTAAKVSDEAEWDIGPAARAALGVSRGLDPNAARSTLYVQLELQAAPCPSMFLRFRIHVTRDDSYISFMFDRDTSGSNSQQVAKSELVSDLTEPGRRRIFRQGTEVTYEASSKVEQQASDEPEAKDDGEKKATGSSKGGKTQQPRSISAASSKSIANPDPPRPNASGVRRHRLEGFLKPPSGPSGFVKPAGIVSASNTSAKRTREDEPGGTDENRQNDSRRRRS
ncbi:hypothetical protein FRC08_004677 [Ceratobasidium sp. 394]|nr:hypothetical protein FRC08_004677 [Ceratobasidium sp. 394]